MSVFEITHNEAGSQQRLNFVRNLLKEQLNIEEGYEITPLAYDPTCPFKYNNFVYLITLASSPDCDAPQPLSTSGRCQPGCQPLPGLSQVKSLVARLANSSAEDSNIPNRIENEVSIMDLARTATAQIGMHVVPDVYAWANTADSAQGWTLQEFMLGVTLDSLIPDMSVNEKRSVFKQIVPILSALQNVKLPETVSGFGGLTYGANGEMVSAVMATVGAGPWDSTKAMYAERFQMALKKADENTYIRGWRENGVREMLDRFVATELSGLFEDLIDPPKKCVVHGDFTTNNILYDPESKRVSALLDFDFACISHPVCEYVRSFDEYLGGKFVGYSDNDGSEELRLRNAKLSGFSTILSPKASDGTEGDIDWVSARIWEEELVQAGVLRPSTLTGIATIADVDALLSGILPWRITNEDVLKMQSEETILDCRQTSETTLLKMLERIVS